MNPAGEQRIFHLLQLAAHRVKTDGDRQSLDVAGISAAQAAVLFVVRKNPGATQRSVADALKIQESAVTAMVGRLVRDNLLTRRPAPEDRRAWRLELTDQAVAALDRFRPALDDLNRRITTAVGGAEAVEALAQALAAIIQMPGPAGEGRRQPQAPPASANDDA